jgi:hypothetical protein
MKKDLKKILVGLTGNKEQHWRSKLDEIKKYKITKIALFLECFKKSQREKIYKALLASNIEEIPLVHIRHDMTKQEIQFLEKNFKVKCFTIHEFNFNHLKKWNGFYKKLFLEMNTDNIVPKNVDINKIGGFCIDLSHFKVTEKKKTKDFEYIMKRKNIARYFKCNHLNGYSYKKNTDLHTVKSLKEFSYLKTLPKFLFGELIALETNNPISQQLKFKNHVIKLLS